MSPEARRKKHAFPEIVETIQALFVSQLGGTISFLRIIDSVAYGPVLIVLGFLSTSRSGTNLVSTTNPDSTTQVQQSKRLPK